MVKNDICLGVQANKLPYCSKNVPQKNAPMPPKSGIDPEQ